MTRNPNDILTLELDTAHDDIDGYLDEVRRTWDIDTSVVIEHGPAGGWPVVVYTGRRDVVEDFVRHEFYVGPEQELGYTTDSFEFIMGYED